MKISLPIILCSVGLFLAACKDKMVCAAYQSTYILDIERQSKKFSFFEGDSLILEASNTGLKKNIYGIRERDFGFWQQQRLLVVDQKDVYSEEVDSLLNNKLNPAEQLAESGVDSAQYTSDTVSLKVKEDPWANTKRFHYNVDFVNYMLLVGNDVLRAQSAQRDSAQVNEGKEQVTPLDTASSKSKGFFQKVFKAKVKDKPEKEVTRLKVKEEKEGDEEAPTPEGKEEEKE